MSKGSRQRRPQPPIDDEVLIKLWWLHYRLEVQSSETAPHPHEPPPTAAHEAAEQLQRLIFEGDRRAWIILRKLINSAPDEAGLAYVAAGPLEELLRDGHGDLFVDAAVAAAEVDSNFRSALECVWLYQGRALLSEHSIQKLQRFVVTLRD